MNPRILILVALAMFYSGEFYEDEFVLVLGGVALGMILVKEVKSWMDMKKTRLQ